MLVQINTFVPKRGQQNKVVELIKLAENYGPFKVPYRILLPSIGKLDLIVHEMEFKDLAEHEKFWSGWFDKAPESFWQEWFAVTENGGSNEIWQLAE